LNIAGIVGVGRKARALRRKSKNKDLLDVFLSYRVNTDQKLVQDLYWRLVGTDDFLRCGEWQVSKDEALLGCGMSSQW
jgi:hypothetical protein